jgi:hypothetical protein
LGHWKEFFYSLDPGHNRLTLTEVVLHPSAKEIEGFSHYYRSEVISIRVLDAGAYAGDSTKSETAGNWNLMHKDQRAVQPGKVKESDVMNIMSRDTAMNWNNLSEEEYDTLNKLVDNHVLIKHVGDEFRGAVEDIKAESAVSLSMEGAMFGPYSQASLLSISTPSCAFLFDIYTLGDAAFDNGLRDILELEKIEKVIHNCHILSEYLHQKHRVTICSVCDTQVMDLRVTHLQCGQVPCSVRSLPQCLSIYLNLPENLVHHPQIHDGSIVLDSLQWNKRPLPVELEIAAVKNSVFLLHLRKQIWKKFWHLSYRGFDVFLSVMRDKDKTEAGEYMAHHTKIPPELCSLSDEP